ncbi:MAG: HAMP domain-containing sensor histidine kinase [Arcobacteraceae bacterium]
MKTKKTDFIISHYIVIFIIIVIALYSQIILLQNLNYTNLNIIFFVIPIALMSIFAYKIFTKPLFENIFKSEKNLDTKIKKTLHEINTPVATILLNTKMLKKAAQDEKTVTRIDRIEQACNDLLALYDDMEYAIKKEIEKIDIQEFILKEAILETKRKFEELLHKSNIQCSIDIDSSIFVKTDKKGFTTAISNLLSNAVKYNKPDGYIKIYVKNKTLYIEDSGIGIDPKNLFLVFDSFYQENSKVKGFGLGLSIVKEFCDNNKIAINIKSKEQSYTIVSLDIKNIMI